MFDFDRLKIRPIGSVAKPPATDLQIAELEKHCGYPLPENYKLFLKTYNGGYPATKYFEVANPYIDILDIYQLNRFFHLDIDIDKTKPLNIWWIIDVYSKYLDANSFPFADDGLDQLYFMNWIDNTPQIWFVPYLDFHTPEPRCLFNTFDELLESLYAADY